jgi:hypothetical protein
MKTIKHILTLAVLIVFASPVLAAEKVLSTDKPMRLSMETMHKHMQSMQQKMNEIKITKDPKKRQPLMQQHMQSMREGMMMMNESSNSKGMMMGGMSQPMMQEKKEGMDCQKNDRQCERMQTMGSRQEGMHERMNMMQMMMQQMLDHQSAQVDQ